jgi:membrane associated rhomboid family serine protease
MAFLIYPLAVIVGFVVLFFGATFLLGQVAGTMPYETALPLLLSAGAAGAIAGVMVARWLLKRRAQRTAASGR